MKLVNLTSHEVVIDGGPTIPACTGNPARVATKNILKTTVDGIRYYKQKIGKVVNLPEPEPGVYYIVSSTVRAAVPNRVDVVSPGYPIRDARGKVVACDGLVFNDHK